MEDAYLATHQAALEGVISTAVTEAVTNQVDNPLVAIARTLLDAAQVSYSIGSAATSAAVPAAEGRDEGGWTARAWVASLAIVEPIAQALLGGAGSADELKTLRALAKGPGPRFRFLNLAGCNGVNAKAFHNLMSVTHALEEAHLNS